MKCQQGLASQLGTPLGIENIETIAWLSLRVDRTFLSSMGVSCSVPYSVFSFLLCYSWRILTTRLQSHYSHKLNADAINDVNARKVSLEVSCVQCVFISLQPSLLSGCCDTYHEFTRFNTFHFVSLSIQYITKLKTNADNKLYDAR